MRLKGEPHASRPAEQVVLRDPLYVVQTLDDHLEVVLAGAFRELIGVFNALPIRQACARCGRTADGLCA